MAAWLGRPGATAIRMKSDRQRVAHRQVPESIPGSRRTSHLQDGGDREKKRLVSNPMLEVPLSLYHCVLHIY